MNNSKTKPQFRPLTMIIKILLILSIILPLSCERRLRASREFRDLIQEIKLDWKGEKRRALIYNPQMPGTHPAIFVLHGGGGKPENAIAIDEEFFLKSAKEKGFIVIYPEGINKKWNDHRNDPAASEDSKTRDDVGFIRELVRVSIESHSVDKNKIYLTGMSNGGMMSYRLACEMPETFQEVFPVVANMPHDANTLCQPKVPVSISVFNGTEDPLVPYYGGTVKVFGKSHGEIISTDESIRFWAEKANCKNKTTNVLPKKFPDDPTQVYHHKWDCPSNRVDLFEIRGGGHTWPGGIKYLPEMLVGKTTKELVASRIIAERIMEK